ncbi:putative DnaJ domain, Chaperone J-domain superfamily [Helianthus annuus]|uniref:DnaJ domain, Chaperone J-domain superfamily n=1 Tax=Helianthus annuus TaxID=4232 RepID=A0A251SFM6_HELAN|nr:chaperone protein dnaJ 11, chloroplastic [Helianthus annuus]KAF5767421.1 putative DnaJ domain, Chaperone J-domain superfamily [Helianthus annuus]KAJ0462968.1 putative DnaJ domain, Chaperone J-domain superfamily [Helianthus annuus]KAJ0466756.1 putative DnaJ domain, Chaperone J-domain superfamily [Helianthus annuus]KAJ0484326.1 putative DnaJ domain, Chaperone J-domain superfamily [Helianthus annuus]KAJ0654879.1 putative DnaJ domain, Chaperone J-domain superfamily [Helianthus annuus]
MAIISTSSSFFTSPNPQFNSHKPSHSSSSSVRFGRARVSAGYTTAERTGNTSSSSLYEVLGVGVGADTLVVKAAYRRLARVLHPDVGSCESSADEFMKVHLAYTTLVDPEKRAAYDRSLVQRRTVVSSSMRYAPGYRSRRWETDQCW